MKNYHWGQKFIDNGEPLPSTNNAPVTIERKVEGDYKEPSYIEIQNNHIYFYADIDRHRILQLNKELTILNNNLLNEARIQTRQPSNIYLHVNSYGGGIFSGFAGMDAILRSEVPVISIVDGCCASAATFLSVVGKERWINKNAFVLIHQLSAAMWGKYTEFEDEMKNLEMLMKTIKRVYAQYTEVPKEKLDEILKHDLWFDAETCLKYKLVDKII